MTWEELKTNLDGLSEDQLRRQVSFFDRQNQEIWWLALYIADEPLVNPRATSESIEKGEPYLDFLIQ